MKIKFIVLAALVALVALGVSWAATPDSASATGVSVRHCNSDWYQNPDETSRKPVQKPKGMLFKGDQLVHHKTDLPLANLKPGYFVANQPPSLTSFFSVEVYDDTTQGYATLRWDTATHVWVLGGTSTTHASAKDFVGATTRSGKVLTANTRVVSFGVGYVANPANGTPTLVSAVIFRNRRHSLACAPAKPVRPPYGHHPNPTPSAPVTTPPATTAPGEAPAPTPVKVAHPLGVTG